MRRILLLLFAFVAAGVLAGCTDPAAPQADPYLEAPQYVSVEDACWGQATAVFAHTGEMGQHASQQPTPRLGLANLAEALYEDGSIAEPTIQALGAFVADALGLSVDACM